MAIKKHLLSPRQKMINLLYVVLMAMLALNVSSEVLDGFDIVGDGLEHSLTNTEAENKALYEDIKRQWQLNPEKAQLWYSKATEARTMSDSLCLFTEGLKKEIIRVANGNSGTDSLRNKDDLEAAAHVMLAPGSGKGDKLFMAISNYRNRMATLIGDSEKRKAAEQALSTDVPKEAGRKQWKEYMFEAMPAVAAVTILTKLQTDIRYVEGEVLHTLYTNIDAGDTRVNRLTALVVPETRTVIRGNRFSAQVVMAAVDTTQVPEIFIHGKKTKLNNGIYETVCNKTGNFSFAGWLETKETDGHTAKRMFRQDYTVVEPTATVAADLMNVLYAGFDNPISVSVPGVPLKSVTATATGGTLRQTAEGRYIAKPVKAGQDMTVTVSAETNGNKRIMAEHTFKVRRLPAPSPFITLYNGEHFTGGSIRKTEMLKSTKMEAAVDDGMLYIPFTVQSFDIVFFDNMGNAVPMASQGATLSPQQRDAVKRMTGGRRLYVTRLAAKAPDGSIYNIKTPMEVIVK